MSEKKCECARCGEEFEIYHNGDGWQANLCSECHNILMTTGEVANDHEQREFEKDGFEIDTDRTAEWESYKRRQVIK